MVTQMPFAPFWQQAASRQLKPFGQSLHVLHGLELQLNVESSAMHVQHLHAVQPHPHVWPLLQ